MDGSTKHTIQMLKHIKYEGKKIEEKIQGVSYELTVLHLSLTGVECLVDNVSFKDSPWGSV